MLHFTKMQGLGNDYVYLDCTHETPTDLPALARRLSDRHFGVGGDGLICVFPSRNADFRMRIFNADGSEGEMCGNGIRCAGKFIYDNRHSTKTDLTVETLAGIMRLTLIPDPNGLISSVTVDMGRPAPEPPLTVVVGGKSYSVTPISMGNPHAVLYLEDIDGLDLTTIGPGFEYHPAFPNRTNTEFVQVLDRTHLKMRVWERGSGETLACGTGACAVLVASVCHGLCDRSAQVHLPGGALDLHWGEDDHVYMTGPAVTVFEGDIAL